MFYFFSTALSLSLFYVVPPPSVTHFQPYLFLIPSHSFARRSLLFAKTTTRSSTQVQEENEKNGKHTPENPCLRALTLTHRKKRLNARHLNSSRKISAVGKSRPVLPNKTNPKQGVQRRICLKYAGVSTLHTG